MIVIFFGGHSASRFVFALWRRNVRRDLLSLIVSMIIVFVKIGNYLYVMSFSERVCVVCVRSRVSVRVVVLVFLLYL